MANVNNIFEETWAKSKLREKIALTGNITSQHKELARDIAYELVQKFDEEYNEKFEKYIAQHRTHQTQIVDAMMKKIGMVSADGQELRIKIKNAVGYEQELFELRKHHLDDLYELLNNLNDDLELDPEGENGYKSEVESYTAVVKYTLQVLQKKIIEKGGIIDGK